MQRHFEYISFLYLNSNYLVSAYHVAGYTLRGLGSFKVPGEAEPKDFVSVDLAENFGTIVNDFGTKQPLKNLLSMLIKDKDITSYLLLLIKQDRELVN